MERIEKVLAMLNLGDQQIIIGEIVANQRQLFFKYHPDFLENGVEISPFKLKLSPEIVSPRENHFDGLFGVFSDSIPDGWGRLLLDRKLMSEGITDNISPLDRLCFLDKNAMGAITYQPQYETELNDHNLDLDHIANDIAAVLHGDAANVIDELFQLGGSSGGARPKILVGYNPLTGILMQGSEILPQDFEHWIIKFASSADLPDIALLEFAYNQMAKKAGIEVNEFKLFKSGKGQYFFGSKRFDRIGNEKVHLHSVAGLLHDNFRLSTLDYGHIMDCAFRLETDFNAYEKILRLAAFNVFAHNRDDHSKNFSFLMDKNGSWKFAPAYDLTYSNSSFGYHSTSVAGEIKNPGEEHLTRLAHHYGVKNAALIFDEVKAAIAEFKKIAKEAGVSKDSAKLVYNNIQV